MPEAASLTSDEFDRDDFSDMIASNYSVSFGNYFN